MIKSVAGDTGKSKRAVRRQFKSAEISLKGHCLQVKLEECEGQKPVGGKRGQVYDFSRAARLRMLRLFASIPFVAGVWVSFLTLTFGEAFPSAYDSLAYLERFERRMKRRYPNFSAIWRKELQERGAPHFHLMMWGLPFVDKHWIQRTWMECVWELLTPAEIERYRESLSRGDRNPQGLVTRIEGLRSWRKAMSYVSKYCAKPSGLSGLDNDAYLAAGIMSTDGELQSSGGWWGWIQKDKLPVGGVEVVNLPFGPWVWKFRRVCGRFWKGCRREERGGFTLFLDGANMDGLRRDFVRLVDLFAGTDCGKELGTVCPF